MTEREACERIVAGGNCEYCREVDRVPLIHDSGMYVEVAGDELRVFGDGYHECGIKYCPMCGRRLR